MQRSLKANQSRRTKPLPEPAFYWVCPNENYVPSPTTTPTADISSSSTCKPTSHPKSPSAFSTSPGATSGRKFFPNATMLIAIWVVSNRALSKATSRRRLFIRPSLARVGFLSIVERINPGFGLWRVRFEYGKTMMIARMKLKNPRWTLRNPESYFGGWRLE